MATLYRDKEWLYKQYHEQGKSGCEIAEICDVSSHTIYTWMRKHGIERRSENNKEGKHNDKEWLIQEYVEKERSTHDIASEIEVTAGTINYNLEKFGIVRRDKSTAGGRAARESITPDELCNEEWLREKYIEDGLSQSEIAELVDRAPHAVSRAMRRLGIETRKPGPQPGPEHPLWKGGRPRYYGENWGEMRQKAIERDGGECRVCGINREEHREQHGDDIQVHHIRPIMEFDEPEDANTLDNLITLCRPDHMKWEGIPVVPNGVSD